MPQKKKVIQPTETKICKKCRKEKKLTLFYTVTNSALSNDGQKVDICKTCIKNDSYNSDGSLNIELFKQQLLMIDKPFVPEALESAIKETNKSVELGKGRTDVIGTYFKNITSLPQYSKLGFLQSLNLIEQGKGLNSSIITTTEKKNRVKEDVYIKQIDNFVVTDDIIDLFGEGYTKSQYRLMTKKYNRLKENYPIQSNIHEEALVTYVRFKVKEEEATVMGDVSSADKWNKAAQEAADKAKLTPKQLTAADLQNGVTCIAEISKACEQAVDIIDILPRFRYQPNDAPDFIIYCYINYCRKLKGLPQAEYKDIYSFYDKKKKEYLKQYGDPYGIFEGDPTEKNRPNIKEFIKLPKDYNIDNGDE